MTDESAIAELVTHVPGAIKNRMVTKLADDIRPVIREAIMYERARASAIAVGVRKDAQQMVHQAQVAKDNRMLIAADAAARAAHGIAGLIMQAPGECATCRGSRSVPSTLVQGMSVPCADCPVPSGAKGVREIPVGA